MTGFANGTCRVHDQKIGSGYRQLVDNPAAIYRQNDGHVYRDNGG